MMFIIPPIPSASYFAGGLVITSIDLIALAGIALIASLKFFTSIPEDFPFTSTLKFVSPLRRTTSSPSTLNIGTLRIMSTRALEAV